MSETVTEAPDCQLESNNSNVASTEQTAVNANCLLSTKPLIKPEKEEFHSLHEAACEYTRNKEAFKSFIHKAIFWYQKHENEYIRALNLIGLGLASLADLSMTLNFIQAPFSEIERYLIYDLLGPNQTGEVECAKLAEVLWEAYTNPTFNRFGTSTLLDQEEENWLLLALRIPSLEASDSALNFHALVTTSYTGAMLCHLIKIRQVNLPSRAIILFTDPSKYSETIVHCDQSLYEIGFEGGKRTLPREGTLYYEFSTGHIDCPLLMGLHNFECIKKGELIRPEVGRKIMQ